MIRGLAICVTFMALLAVATPARAEDPSTPPAATSDQVEKLQAQLEQMSKELESMRKTVDSSNLPSQQRQQMMHHMGQMEGHMHGMMTDCCRMDPGSCPGHMGTTPSQP